MVMHKFLIQQNGLQNREKSDRYILTFNAVIENDWHLYSQLPQTEGPLPLEIIFQKIKREQIKKQNKNDTMIFWSKWNIFEKKSSIQQEITKSKLTEIKVDFLTGL
jgi:thiol:disulfide interchange protein DsbD